jgi:hypothetical protein
MYAEFGDALIENLVVFLFEPRATPLGQVLHLAGWFAGLTLGLIWLYKGLFETSWRNFYREAMGIAAVMLVYALLTHNLFPYARFFGLAGQMLAIITAMTGWLILTGCGTVFTYKTLVRRGVEMPNVTSLLEFLAARQAAAENPPPQ